MVELWFSTGTFRLISDTKKQPPLLSSLCFTHIYTHTLVFDRPGNGAVEMFSRRTMQIRPSLQGDTVNGFNHHQNLQRGVCMCLCAYAGISNTNMPLASCKQIRELQKKNKQSTGKIWNRNNVHSGPLPLLNRQTSIQFWEKIFSHTDPDFGNENKDGCQTGIRIKILQ